MQERILSLVEALDESRKDVLSRLEELTDEQLRFRPKADSWSPLDIAEHHVRAERGLFCNLPKPEQCTHVSPTFTHHFSRWWRRSVLKWRIPVPVPSRAMHPTGELCLKDIAAMWGDDMAWLREHVENMPAASLNNACFPHPIAGPLTLEQTLEMAVLHVNYHLPELEDRIKATRAD